MDCKFCNDYVKLLRDKGNLKKKYDFNTHLVIKLHRYLTRKRRKMSSLTWGNYTVNYCPVCGKELRKRRDKDET